MRGWNYRKRGCLGRCRSLRTDEAYGLSLRIAAQLNGLDDHDQQLLAGLTSASLGALSSLFVFTRSFRFPSLYMSTVYHY